MLKHKPQLSQISGWIFTAAFILLSVALIGGAVRFPWDASAVSVPAEPLKNFTYEIAGGNRGTATFPHSFKNLPPKTAVTINTEVEPGQYEYILVKTVYTRLQLYADDVLIYECGSPESYPGWLADPPTFLKNIPLPATASHLRFEYISPSQRSTMSVPKVMAGESGSLLLWLFGRDSALLVISIFLLLLGLGMTVLSLLFGREASVFRHLGLFALAVGAWGIGECNATAFLIPYPTLLYLMAFAGLFTFIIPLLRYGLLILNPQNPLIMKLVIVVTEAAAALAFLLQLTGLVSLSKSMYLFHILIPLGLVLFAVTVLWEHFRYKNPAAKSFALPALVLAAAAILEVLNYSLRFTNVLSLCFLSGAFVFTLLLGVIGIHYVSEMQRRFDEVSAKTDFYHKMSHDLLTPLTRVSTNVQTARRVPEEADGLLQDAQTDIMGMAEMINTALREGGKEKKEDEA